MADRDLSRYRIMASYVLIHNDYTYIHVKLYRFYIYRDMWICNSCHVVSLTLTDAKLIRLVLTIIFVMTDLYVRAYHIHLFYCFISLYFVDL